MIEYLEQIDQQLLLWINGVNSPFWDKAMWTISDTKFGIPLYIVFIYLTVKSYTKPQAFKIIVVALIVVALADLTSKHLFKDVFMRYRPSHNLNLKDQLHIVNNYRGGMYGFVSSHSANMFALATYFSLILSRKSRLLILFFMIYAGIIAYSRVYLGVHYPSDILAGGILGSIIGWIGYTNIKGRL